MYKSMKIALGQMNAMAEQHKVCKRKAVGCALLLPIGDSHFKREIVAYNGSSLSAEFCTNEVGNCGCMHAEQKAIIQWLTMSYNSSVHNLICLSTYSPCTNCANVIIHSGVIGTVVYGVLTKHDTRGNELLIATGIRVMTTEEFDAQTRAKLVSSDEAERIARISRS